jgi:hypothetical protein
MNIGWAVDILRRAAAIRKQKLVMEWIGFRVVDIGRLYRNSAWSAG